jgi:hypothetical protein
VRVWARGLVGTGPGLAFLTRPQPVPVAAGRAGTRPPAATQCRSIQAEFEIEINETSSLISISHHVLHGRVPLPSNEGCGPARLRTTMDDGGRRVNDDDRGPWQTTRQRRRPRTMADDAR